MAWGPESQTIGSISVASIPGHTTDHSHLWIRILRAEGRPRPGPITTCVWVGSGGLRPCCRNSENPTLRPSSHCCVTVTDDDHDESNWLFQEICQISSVFTLIMKKLFLKKIIYFIDYAITVVPFPPLHSTPSCPPPSLPHLPPIVYVHGSYL